MKFSKRIGLTTVAAICVIGAVVFAHERISNETAQLSSFKKVENAEIVDVFPDNSQIEVKKNDNDFILPVDAKIEPLLATGKNASLICDSKNQVIGINMPTAKENNDLKIEKGIFDSATAAVIMKASNVKVVKVAQVMNYNKTWSAWVSYYTATFDDGKSQTNFLIDEDTSNNLKQGYKVDIWYNPYDGFIRKVVPTGL